MTHSTSRFYKLFAAFFTIFAWILYSIIIAALKQYSNYNDLEKQCNVRISSVNYEYLEQIFKT